MAKAPVTKAAVTKAATNAKPAAKASNKASDAKTVPGIFVRSFPPTFRRVGFEFTAEGFGLLLKDLSEEQLEAIRNEPMLSVQDVEIPATAEDDALLQQQAEIGANETANTDGAGETPPGGAA